MVEHMVWIKFHDDVDEVRQQHHLTALAALKGRVPGILEIAVGQNFTERAGGYTHGLLVRLASRDDLKRYANHPQHIAVAGPLNEDADLLALDFEHA